MENTVTRETVSLAIGAAIGTIIIQRLLKSIRRLRERGLKSIIASFLLRFSKYRQQLSKGEQEMKDYLKKTYPTDPASLTKVLPDIGDAEIHRRFESFYAKDQGSHNPHRISASIYHENGEITDVITESMRHFIYANPLFPGLYPSVRQMEIEIISMTINLFHGNSSNCGVITSGGTESLLMAVLAYREWGKNKGIEECEIVAGDTIHAAVDKAAFYFGVKLIKVPVCPKTGKMVISSIKRRINSKTVAIFASAPNYPNGMIDPLEDLGKLSEEKGINFHIDACLGGFLIPFVQDAGFELPLCDFRVRGVTSISCDVHKYGYSPKGISVLMYKNKELRRLQYFVCPDWSGGIYVTPTLAGSRPGLISVGTWAALMFNGKSGYIASTHKVLKAARYIRDNCNFEHVKVFGEPLLSVIAFESNTLNVHAIGNALTKIGQWAINYCVKPNRFHFCVTDANADSAPHFVEDLYQAMLMVQKHPELNNYETAAIYGMMGSVPDKNIVGQISKYYGDIIFS